MKISKFVQTIKSTGQCIVIHTPGEIYLSTGYSIYKATEFPDITGVSQIAAVLDIEPKKLKKIHIEERRCTGRSDICGYDFSEGSGKDIEINKLRMAAVADSNIYAAFYCEGDGELLFFDEQLLAPIRDRIKDEESYINYTARIHHSGLRYIVVKDGFEVLAAILPVKVLTDEYMRSLHNFLGRCEIQYKRERSTPPSGKSPTREEAIEDDE